MKPMLSNTLTPDTMKSITDILESDSCLESVKAVENGQEIMPIVPGGATPIENNNNAKGFNLWQGGVTTVLTPSKVR